jgi:hypothetical protein
VRWHPVFARVVSIDAYMCTYRGHGRDRASGEKNIVAAILLLLMTWDARNVAHTSLRRPLVSPTLAWQGCTQGALIPVHRRTSSSDME